MYKMGDIYKSENIENSKSEIRWEIFYGQAYKQALDSTFCEDQISGTSPARFKNTHQETCEDNQQCVLFYREDKSGEYQSKCEDPVINDNFPCLRPKGHPGCYFTSSTGVSVQTGFDTCIASRPCICFNPTRYTGQFCNVEVNREDISPDRCRFGELTADNKDCICAFNYRDVQGGSINFFTIFIQKFLSLRARRLSNRPFQNEIF